METKQGFKFEGKRIYYIDAQGKDISFDRWRVSLYYAPHLAATHFLSSQAEYDRFLEDHRPDTFSEYEDFRALAHNHNNCKTCRFCTTDYLKTYGNDGNDPCGWDTGFYKCLGKSEPYRYYNWQPTSVAVSQ